MAEPLTEPQPAAVLSADEQARLIEEHESESPTRALHGGWRVVTGAAAVTICLYALYGTQYNVATPVYRATFLLLALVLVFLLFPSTYRRADTDRQHRRFETWMNLAVGVTLAWIAGRLVDRLSGARWSATIAGPVVVAAGVGLAALARRGGARVRDLQLTALAGAMVGVTEGAFLRRPGVLTVAVALVIAAGAADVFDRRQRRGPVEGRPERVIEAVLGAVAATGIGLSAVRFVDAAATPLGAAAAVGVGVAVGALVFWSAVGAAGATGGLRWPHLRFQQRALQRSWRRGAGRSSPTAAPSGCCWQRSAQRWWASCGSPSEATCCAQPAPTWRCPAWP